MRSCGFLRRAAQLDDHEGLRVLAGQLQIELGIDLVRAVEGHVAVLEVEALALDVDSSPRDVNSA